MSDRLMIEKILRYMEDHLDQELTLEKIAKEFHYSKFYLTRRFKENTGVTPYKYMQGRRLDRAARKLAETSRPIVEIALEAGYHSQQAFTQAFRDTYGQTPQEYRRTGIFIPRQNRIFMDLSGVSQSSLSWIFRLERTERRAAA